jgi:acylphosphatase
MTATKRLLATGIVQGVGYRASFEAQARALKLAGWVRNRADGSVEAVVAGSDDAVDRIIEWARRGPSSARVDRLLVDDPDRADGQSIEPDVFTVRPTV